MDVAGLRALALDALGPHGDARARGLLERADVTLDEAVRTWEASAGAVRGHRVRVGVDARSLGVVRAAPLVADALHAALARAFTAHPGESLAELVIEWNGSVAGADEGYRGAHPADGRARLGEALAEYLDGAGERDAAARVREGFVEEPSPGAVAVHGRADALTVTAVRDAARALLGEKTAVQWRPR